MAIEIISRSISMKVCDRAMIELAISESAVRNVSAVRHVLAAPLSNYCLRSSPIFVDP